MAYEPDGEDGFRLLWYLNFNKVGSGGLLTALWELAEAGEKTLLIDLEAVPK